MRKPLVWSALVIIIAAGAVLGGLACPRTDAIPQASVATRVMNPPINEPASTPTATPPTVIAGIQPEVLARYRTEAAAGDAGAQDNLAVCYEQGLGLAADPAQAAFWYRKAAEQGFAPAQYHLGECLERGLGVPRDLTQAVDLYRRAAGNGISQAKVALDRLGTPPHG